MNGERPEQSDVRSRQKRPLQRRLLVGLLVLAFLTPFGILLPRIFRADGAWGEWSAERLATVLGYLPEGMKRSAHVWKAPLSDYTFSLGSGSLASRSFTYAVSGVLGILVVVCLVFLLMKVVKRHER
jgi:hypothetical protein